MGATPVKRHASLRTPTQVVKGDAVARLQLSKLGAMLTELEALWRREVEAIYPRLRGKLVPADLFDEVRRLLQERRAKR